MVPRWPCVAVSWALLFGSFETGGAKAPKDVAPEEFYGSFEVPSLANVSYEDVRELLLQGRPLVITDGAKGLPMEEWDCDFVKTSFPESRIRLEGGNSDVNNVPMNSDWAQSAKQFRGAETFPPGAPRLRPLYWDIAKAYADERHRKWGKKPAEVVKKILRSTSVPYWLPAQDSKTMGRSSEMWFHPPGAGAPAHMDPHCQTTVSFCFSGKRKWRMMLPPSTPHSDGYFDGQIYGAEDPTRKGEWQPAFEMEAPAGSAVLVYPGMIHETLSTGEECSSSISQTFEVPVAAAYYRAFWPRFSLIHEDVGSCAPIVEDLVVLGSGEKVAGASEAEARRAGAAFAARADANGDGTVSAQEVDELRRRRGRSGQRTVEEYTSFHDVDRDKVVTVREVEDSWIMFATATRRAERQRLRHGTEL